MDINILSSCSENTEFIKRRILFLSTDIECSNNNDSFLFMARMARQLGHDVIIVTTQCKYIEELSSFIVHQIGGFIPKTIFRRFYGTLYFFRTIYLVIWLLINVNCLNPTFVIVQNAIAVLPLLKRIGNLQVVLVHKLPDGEMIEWVTNIPKSKKRILHKFLITHADEIIVTNQAAKTLYSDLFIGSNQCLSVLHPCVNLKEFEKCSITDLRNIILLPHSSLLFACFGPLEPSSNFELAIRAYVLVLNEILMSDPFLFIKLNLVIISEKASKKHEDYFDKLSLFALKLCHNKPSIYFLESNELKARKTIMKNCIAVLHPMLNSFDGRWILEAGLMKVPVLAVDSGIAKELIVDGINGFLLEPQPYVFANCMQSLLSTKRHKSINNYNYIIEHYTISKYNLQLKDIVNRNSEHEQNTITYEE